MNNNFHYFLLLTSASFTNQFVRVVRNFHFSLVRNALQKVRCKKNAQTITFVSYINKFNQFDFQSKRVSDSFKFFVEKFNLELN